MKNKSLRRQNGLNLLEVLIAALVLSVGLLGLAGLQVSSLKTAQNASFKQQATFVIYELLERMRSNRQAVLAGDYAQTLQCNQSPPAACTTTCSAAALATYDLYQVLCGNGATGAGGSGQLLDSQLEITCLTNGQCEDGLRLSLTWTERIEQKGISTNREQGDGEEGQAVAPEAEQETFTLQVDAVI